MTHLRLGPLQVFVLVLLLGGIYWISRFSGSPTQPTMPGVQIPKRAGLLSPQKSSSEQFSPPAGSTENDSATGGNVESLPSQGGENSSSPESVESAESWN